jgi:hypothetical protein
MLKRLITFFALSVSMLAACKSFAVNSQYSRGENFNDYKTFSFSPTAALPPAGYTTGHLFNSIMQRRVQDEVSRVLTSRGYSLVPRAEASFQIKISGGGNRAIQVADPSTSDRSGAVEGAAVVVDRGALVLHFFDPAKKKIIWRGWAEAVMSPDDDFDKKVRAAVREILAAYPPKGD